MFCIKCDEKVIALFEGGLCRECYEKTVKGRRMRRARNEVVKMRRAQRRAAKAEQG